MEPERIPIAFTVNRRSVELRVEPHHTLLAVLRDQVQLTGTKECCSEGECGACTVLVDEVAVNACLMLGVEADGCAVTTIEGLAEGGRLSAMQAAFLEHGAVQCGFCIPGMVMAATACVTANPSPTTADIQEALAGNLCRCGGYGRIVAAVHAAAEASDAARPQEVVAPGSSDRGAPRKMRNPDPGP
jgi:aerobic-type carbon monoxide dehydrogenase small subunit (CoxS/CutS family)